MMIATKPQAKQASSVTPEMQERIAKVIAIASSGTVKVDPSRISGCYAINKFGQFDRNGQFMLIQIDNGLNQYELSRSEVKAIAAQIAATERQAC